MQKIKRFLFVLFLLIAVITLPASAATTKRLSKSAKKMTVNVGKYKLKIKGETVKWKAKNNSILQLNKKGVLTAKKSGRTKISYKLAGKTKSIKVTVKSKKSSRSSRGGGSSSGYCYISATGSKYHKKNNCGRMNPNKATRLTISAAKSRGYTACSKCY